MKKTIITILAAIAMTAGTSTAQSIYYGPKLGINFSSLSKVSNATNKVGFALGAYAGYRLTDVWSVQGEMLYSWQGAKVDGAKISINYLKIPILGKLILYENLSAEAGISLNFLTTAKVENTSLGGINDFDFTIPVGVSYLVAERFEVGLRYDIALANVGFPGASTAKNNNWLLSFAYRF